LNAQLAVKNRPEQFNFAPSESGDEPKSCIVLKEMASFLVQPGGAKASLKAAFCAPAPRIPACRRGFLC
jgi:hypothetical protein